MRSAYTIPGVNVFRRLLLVVLGITHAAEDKPGVSRLRYSSNEMKWVMYSTDSGIDSRKGCGVSIMRNSLCPSQQDSSNYILEIILFIMSVKYTEVRLIGRHNYVLLQNAILTSQLL